MADLMLVPGSRPPSPGPVVSHTTVETPEQRERRECNLRIADEYRQQLSWSVFQLAHEARARAASLVRIHEDMAHGNQIASPIAVTRSPAPGTVPRSNARKRRLRLVWSTP